jgi:predicted nuclease of predicted toxin-antitoxin system
LKLFLDQMFRTDVTEALRAEGHDVLRADECGRERADDTKVMDTASADGRILVTLDEDFGDWAVLPIDKHPGVIRLKVHPTVSSKILKLLVPFLRTNKDRDFRNYLAIVSETRVRWIRTAE